MSDFFKNLVKAIDKLKEVRVKKALVIHHDEADGLCSASIVKKALERFGFEVKTLCLDKLFPSVIEVVQAEEERIVFYVDIGSFHANKISQLNKMKNLIIILDHHDTTPILNASVYNLNPELFGLTGEKEASASSTAYFFAKALNEENMDLAHLAVIGSVEIPGEPVGLNKMALEDALKKNLVKASGKEIKVLALNEPISIKRASMLLSILGSVGYYQNGPEIGISVCLNGFSEESKRKALELEEKRRKANEKMLNELKYKGLNQLKNTQWFYAGDIFNNMGTKVIGSFCSYLSFQRIVNPEKYLLGMMPMLKEIPHFGLLKEDYVKVSGRTSRKLAALINNGEKPALSKVLPKVCEFFNGFGDGHSIAASGVFLKGKEEEFAVKFDSQIEKAF
ncbi:DHH family phosphoesterase [Candidatus Bathyarchaeota archaeon]|nr:DHH family phosphoesterase [Candidatus Bathyarchaeota archaeon]